MSDSPLRRARHAAAAGAVMRANEILHEKLQEYVARGKAALNVALSRFSQHPRLPERIIRTIVYRPPSFQLACDQRLRQGAPILAAALSKARRRLDGRPDCSELIAEIDDLLAECGESL